MPIVIDKESGLAQNIPADAVGPQHDVAMIDPEGQHVQVDRAQAPGMLSQGYRQPTQPELEKH